MSRTAALEDDEAALEALEPGQVAATAGVRLPRRHLTRGVVALLIALRLYVLVAIPLVVYAFVHALMTPPR